MDSTFIKTRTMRPMSLRLITRVLSVVLVAGPLQLAAKSPLKKPAGKELRAVAAAPIKGIVRDEQNEPLPGATVKLKGGSASTITGVNGAFTINANRGDIL